MSKLHTYSTYSLGIPSELFLNPNNPSEVTNIESDIALLKYANIYFNTMESGVVIPINTRAILVLPEGSKSTDIKVFVDTQNRFIDPTTILFKPELSIYLNKYIVGYDNDDLVTFHDLINPAINSDLIVPYKIVEITNPWNISSNRKPTTTISYINITPNMQVMKGSFITPYTPLTGIIGNIHLGFLSEYQFKEYFRKIASSISSKIYATTTGTKLSGLSPTEPVTLLILNYLKSKGVIAQDLTKLVQFNLAEYLPPADLVYGLVINESNINLYTDVTNTLGYMDYTRCMNVNYTSMDDSDKITEGYSNNINLDQYICDVTSPDVVFTNGVTIADKYSKSYSISNNGSYYLGPSIADNLMVNSQQITSYYYRVKSTLEAILTAFDSPISWKIYDTCIVVIENKDPYYYTHIFKLFPQYGQEYLRYIIRLSSKPTITVSSNVMSIYHATGLRENIDWYLLVSPQEVSSDAINNLDINFSQIYTIPSLFKNGVYITVDTTDDSSIKRMIREDLPCQIQSS